jgi:hypothetical protein
MKTGSTSLQYFIDDNMSLLSTYGYDRYDGLRGPLNHIDLYLATMRYTRDSFAKDKLKLHTDENFTQSVRECVQNFIANSDKNKLIFTTEGLSYLRFPDEIERLRAVVDADNHDVKIICFLRNKKDFIESYKKQILKIKGRSFSENPESCYYVKEDSWLLDYDAMITAYQKGFGPENVMVIDYDEVVARDSSIIPSYLEFLGVDSNKFSNIEKYYKNVS